MWKAAGTCHRDFTGVCGLGRMHLTAREKELTQPEKRKLTIGQNLYFLMCMSVISHTRANAVLILCQEGVSERDDNTSAQGNLQMMVSGRHKSREESKHCFLHLGSFLKVYISVFYLHVCLYTTWMQCPRISEEGIRSGISDGGEPPCGD